MSVHRRSNAVALGLMLALCRGADARAEQAPADDLQAATAVFIKFAEAVNAKKTAQLKDIVVLPFQVTPVDNPFLYDKKQLKKLGELGHLWVDKLFLKVLKKDPAKVRAGEVDSSVRCKTDDRPLDDCYSYVKGGPALKLEGDKLTITYKEGSGPIGQGVAAIEYTVQRIAGSWKVTGFKFNDLGGCTN